VNRFHLRFAFFAPVALLVMTGCSARVPLSSFPPDHPANPQAPEAPSSAGPRFLSSDAQDRAPLPGSLRIRLVEGGHAGHGAGAEPSGERTHSSGGPHASHGVVQTRPASSESPSTQPSAARAEEEHVCPMHDDVAQKGPGKCPRCGMALVAKEDQP